MKTIIILAATLFAFVAPASAQYYGTGSNPSDHYVNGYTRSNGTYVEPHYQTNPAGYTGDNYSAYGNYNPHNGAYGTRHYGY